LNPQQLEDLTAQAARDGIVQLVVGAVITDAGRVLVLQRPSDDFMGGIWELPSGKVDPGETLAVALAREVGEETGLDLEAITAYLGHVDYTSGSGKPSRQFNFAVHVKASGPVTLTEHTAYLWSSGENLPAVTDAVRQVLGNASAVQGQ
jgi:8-oxo-dGTP diphosphatase